MRRQGTRVGGDASALTGGWAPSVLSLSTCSTPRRARLRLDRRPHRAPRAHRRGRLTAYQSASGLRDLVTPHSAVVVGGIAIARVPYGEYLRFVWPLLAILAVLTVVVLAMGAYVPRDPRRGENGHSHRVDPCTGTSPCSRRDQGSVDRDPTTAVRGPARPRGAVGEEPGHRVAVAAYVLDSPSTSGCRPTSSVLWTVSVRPPGRGRRRMRRPQAGRLIL